MTANKCIYYCALRVNQHTRDTKKTVTVIFQLKHHLSNEIIQMWYSVMLQKARYCWVGIGVMRGRFKVVFYYFQRSNYAVTISFV